MSRVPHKRPRGQREPETPHVQEPRRRRDLPLRGVQLRDLVQSCVHQTRGHRPPGGAARLLQPGRVTGPAGQEAGRLLLPCVQQGIPQPVRSQATFAGRPKAHIDIVQGPFNCKFHAQQIRSEGRSAFMFF